MRVIYLLCTVFTASFAGFDRTCQFLATSCLYDYKFPALIQDLLNFGRDIDDVTSRDNFIIAVYVAIVQFFIPKRILRVSQLVEVVYLGSVLDRAFAAQRREWTDIGMHGCEDLASIVNLAADILWTVIPIQPQSVDGLLIVVLNM